MYTSSEEAVEVPGEQEVECQSKRVMGIDHDLGSGGEIEWGQYWSVEGEDAGKWIWKVQKGGAGGDRQRHISSYKPRGSNITYLASKRRANTNGEDGKELRMNLAKPGEPGEEREEAGPYNDEDEEDGDYSGGEVSASFELLGRGERAKTHPGQGDGGSQSQAWEDKEPKPAIS